MSLAISFDNHLFHEVQWKSHLFSGSQVHCQKTQNRDQQSRTVRAMAALITSIMENPAREERKGQRGLRGSRSSTTLIRSAVTDQPFNPFYSCLSTAWPSGASLLPQGRNRSLFLL